MNKSEELAKLLGIEPKAKKDCDNCPHKRLSAAGVDTCNFSSTYCKYTDISECNLTTYPDFTKPSNFVKLLEVLINSECSVRFYDNCSVSLVDDGWSDYYRENLIEAFIKTITKFMNYASDYQTDFENKFEDEIRLKIIKQAQQQEWEY